MMVFIARALCPALYGIGSSTSSFEYLPLRKTKRSKKMSKDIFLFFIPTAQACLMTEVWKTKKVLRSSFLLSVGACKGPKRPKGHKWSKGYKGR